MLPTLRSGQVVITDTSFTTLHAGQIVSLWYRGEMLVKRIKYVAGDRLHLIPITDGIVDHLRYDHKEAYHRVFGDDFEYSVPPGTVWLEGDNSKNSTDSRRFGAIRIQDIEGVVVYY